MRETTRHRLAFNLYVELGNQRSLETLHARLANNGAQQGSRRPPSHRTLYRWSAALHWQDRLIDLEREARRRDAEAQVVALREMKERHAREGVALQHKGIQRLQALATDELAAADAIRAISEGVRIERLALGEVTDRTQVERSEEDVLKGFSIAELRALAEVAAIRARGDSPAQSG